MWGGGCRGPFRHMAQAELPSPAENWGAAGAQAEAPPHGPPRDLSLAAEVWGPRSLFGITLLSLVGNRAVGTGAISITAALPSPTRREGVIAGTRGHSLFLLAQLLGVGTGGGSGGGPPGAQTVGPPEELWPKMTLQENPAGAAGGGAQPTRRPPPPHPQTPPAPAPVPPRPSPTPPPAHGAGSIL